MESFIVRDSEQDLDGNISHVCTAKASLDGRIEWLFLHIIKTEFPTALQLGSELQRRKVSDYEKIGMATIAASQLAQLGTEVTIEVLTMDQHLSWLCRKIAQSGYRYPLLSHSMDCDIKFMFKSSDRFFNGDPLLYPGDQRMSWQRVHKVCTQRLITGMCPITFSVVNQGLNWGTATLSHLVEKLLHRVQRHNAVDDVIDLVAVLQKAHALDNFTLPNENHMITKPNNRVETSAI